MSTIHTNPYTDIAIFGPLWDTFDKIDPGIDWQAAGTHEKDHKVWVTWRGQQHAIGFAHELCVLSEEKLLALLTIYFGEEQDEESA